MKLGVLHALNGERAGRRAAVLVTDVANDAQRLVKANDVAKDPLKEVLAKRLRMGKSGMEETPQGAFFLTVYVPSPRLVITGAVHISQTLAPIGQLLGYDVIIDDPALKHALARDCFYVGALGSKKTHAKRVDRLKQAGLTDADVSRIHAPI